MPLKFILGFEAWGNKTKEVYYSLLSLKIDFFCFIPQVSQPSINLAINTQFLSRSATNKKKNTLPQSYAQCFCTKQSLHAP